MTHIPLIVMEIMPTSDFSEDGSYFYVICSCGWTCQKRDNRIAALQNHEDHAIEAKALGV